ncbi:response regulator [soil metagenome]
MRKIKKVFLVDDDETSNFLNRILLNQLEIFENIEISKNGKEALKKVMSTKHFDWPELILLDINMPVMDGFEFLEEFYKIKPKTKGTTKVIILTSSNSKRDLEKAKNFKIDGYINKPLTIEKLENYLK